MGIEVVLQQILDQAAQEEQQILRQSQAERDAILSQAEGQADELRSRRLAETRTLVEALRREMTSASEFAARRKLLIARRELTEDFHARLLNSLSTLPKAENEILLAVLVKAAQRALPKGTVHARPADLALLTAAGYTRGREQSGAGGFQVESPDATVLLDDRFETLLENHWKDVLNASRKLFEV